MTDIDRVWLVGVYAGGGKPGKRLDGRAGRRLEGGLPCSLSDVGSRPALLPKPLINVELLCLLSSIDALASLSSDDNRGRDVVELSLLVAPLTQV